MVHAISLFLACSLLLQGCLPSGGSSPAGGSKPVTVWHWMTDRQLAFEQLAQQYEQQTGVKVIFELYAPPDAYSQKVRAAAQGTNLPDIFGILGEKQDFASFIKAGHAMNLTAYMEADGGIWKASLFEKALEVNVFPQDNNFGIIPGIYGVPIDMMSIKMIYNKALLAAVGGDPDNPPMDIEDLIRLGPKIREKKVLGLVSGWADGWLLDCLANNYAFNIMGRDKVMATIAGEVPYTDPDWIKVLDVFARMREAGILSNELVTMVNKTAEQLFANGKAVFAFNGSWGVNVYKGMNPGLQYGVTLAPKASGAHPMSFWGGAGSSFMVNARSNNRDKAVLFLRWLSAAEQQTFLASATNNLPANRNAVKNIPPVLARFSADMDQATYPNTWSIAESPLVVEELDKGIQSIVIGEKSSEQVAREVQKAKERELARRKK